MSKTLTKSEKARSTKLSKKSVEDLVNIILRKDSVERTLQAKVTEVNEKLVKVTDEWGKVMESYQALQAKLENSTKNNILLKKEYNKLDTLYNANLDRFNKADSLVARYKVLAVIATIIAVAAIVFAFV